MLGRWATKGPQVGGEERIVLMGHWDVALAVDLAEPRARAGRVLVVDENEYISRSLTDVLGRAGHSVVAVPSAEQGMHALQAGTFDCLVLGFRLPDLRGDVFYGFAQVGQPQLARRTIFVTRDATDQSASLMERCGCPVFRPPFDVEEFLAVVGAVTSGADGRPGRASEA